MHKLLFILFMVCFFIGKSQTIHVKIKNTTAENINVQLIKSGRIIDFKKTDNLGECAFQVSEKGIFSLKITSLFYKSKVVEIDTSDKSNFEITLEPQIKEIEAVEIKSRPNFAKAKKDTISFNINSVKDGTERTTEDIIKKLPGLDISDNGKITYKGNTVGQVLVEGNEFFGRNHKIATQNISAEMIDKIDLWQNFTTLNGSQSTALNLKLKDKYKGKINGNIEGNYGSNNSYLFHSNVFKFGKFGNLAFISDANNIAKDPISFMDFYEMNSQENSENPNSSVELEVPSFLNNDGKVKSKDNQFGALQFSKSKKSFSISAFSIINNAQLVKFALTNRTSFIDQPQNFNFNEQRTEDNKGFLGTTQIKMKKSFADRSFLYYNFGYNPSEDHFIQDISRYSDSYSYFKVDNTLKNYNVSNYLSWQKQLGHSKIIFTLSHINENNSARLNIFSNYNLFLTESHVLYQNFTINSNKYAFDVYLKNKNSIINFNLHSGYSYKKDISELTELASNSQENRNLKISHYSNDLILYKQVGKFDFSGSISSHVMMIMENENHYFENSLKVKFTPQSAVSKEMSIEYSSKYSTPSIKLLQNNLLYTKELSFSQNTMLNPSIFSKIENYRFTWNRFNMEKGNLLFFILMYEKTKPNITYDVKNYGTFSSVKNTVGQFKERYVSILSNDYRIAKTLNLKSKFSGTIFKDSNFIDGNKNLTTNYNLEVSQKLSTNFKNRFFQFDLGYVYSKSIFEQSIFTTNSHQNNIKLSLGIRTTIKKEWVGNVLGEYLIQKTEQNSLKNFLVGGQISYRKEKSDWEYNVRFNNILNLKSFVYINNYTSLLGKDETAITALQGYILGGIKFNF